MIWGVKAGLGVQAFGFWTIWLQGFRVLGVQGFGGLGRRRFCFLKGLRRILQEFLRPSSGV